MKRFFVFLLALLISFNVSAGTKTFTDNVIVKGTFNADNFDRFGLFPNVAGFPAVAQDGFVAVDIATHSAYTRNAGASTWVLIGGGAALFPTTDIYYVDKNRSDSYTETGSLDKPYKTIMSAINSIAVLAPSRYITVQIESGIYNENVVLEDVGLKYLKLQGHGYVSINPSSGNSLESDSDNDNLVALHVDNIVFAKPVILTGGNGATSFSDVMWKDVSFTGTASLTATCLNNLSFTDVYSEQAIALSNVAWSYIEGGELQGTLGLAVDSTASCPSGGCNATMLANGLYEMGTISYSATGTATYTVAPNGSRWGSGAVTVPSGVTILAHNSVLRGTHTNNGVITLRNSTVQGYTVGTGSITTDSPVVDGSTITGTGIPGDPLSAITGMYVWDGSIPFSTFYTNLNISTLGHPVFITLTGIDHTIDANGGVAYTNLDKLFLWGKALPGSTGVQEVVTIADGATSDTPFNLFRNINLHVLTSTTPFITNDVSKRALYMYIGPNCLIQDPSSVNAVFSYINNSQSSLLIENYGSIAFTPAGSYFSNVNAGGLIITNYLSGQVTDDSVGGAVGATFQNIKGAGYPDSIITFPNFLGTFTETENSYSRDIYYTNSLSGLSSDNTQDAIDELASWGGSPTVTFNAVESAITSDITGVIPSGASVQAMDIKLHVSVVASPAVDAFFTIHIFRQGSSWAITSEYDGGDTDVTFAVNSSSGQLVYSSSTYTGFASLTFFHKVKEI